MRYDAVIIGAGMSGLAAAIRLAMFDKRVLLLERHAVWGGLNSFYSIGGRRFDVGLHALTNYVPPRTRQAPLTKLLRQLRIKHEELQLGEQNLSEILFPGLRLTFTNEYEHFEEQVAAAFPAERDRFAKLVADIREHHVAEDGIEQRSGRAALRDYLEDPLLIEALCLPCCYYGSASEDDVDWQQFVVLFRSLFLEGLARPEGGIRTMINLLIKRYRALGGEIRTRAGVSRIESDGGMARGVVLDDGTEIEADCVISSAGYVETMAMVEGAEVAPEDVGTLTFLESISVLDRMPSSMGHEAATSFYSTRESFRYRPPEDFVDVASGVVSSPNNFQAEEPPAEGMMRLTVLADLERFAGLPEEEYKAAKAKAAERAIEASTMFFPDWRPHTIFRDVFTPRTIKHFTGHVNGAVYGSPNKRLTGETGIHGLYLCGTDQGYLGVIGAMVSGVAMANRHALVAV